VALRTGLGAALSDSVAYGIVAGLVVGKAVGITGGAWLVTRLPGFRLGAGVGRPDIAGIALLGGIGCTVSCSSANLPSGCPRLVRP
jgi:NhaA family Na+:H+ antiporter